LKKILIPLALAVVIAAAVIFYISRDRSSPDGYIVLSGTVEAVEINLGFRAAGRIEYVRYDEGESLSAGDTVSELSHRESDARIRQITDQIAAARAESESLEIEKESLERNLKKITNLLATGGATAGEREDLADRVRAMDAAIKASKSSIKSLMSQRELFRVQHDEEFLLSPIDGTVLLRGAEPGEVVSSGRTVLSVADLSRLEVKVYLPESRLGNVISGQTAFMEIDSHPGRRFEGIITNISDKAEFTPKNIQTKEERVKTVYAVTVSTENYGGILKPGMPCDVAIELTR
jgi:HlyD family secretion protein